MWWMVVAVGSWMVVPVGVGWRSRVVLVACSPPVESMEEEVPDAMFKESCITEQTQYFFDNDERSYAGVLDCGNCSR